MIVTELYNGQGLGNQLWSYVATRCIALENGFDFGIMGSEKFKGSTFLKLDFGKKVVGGEGPEGGPPKSLPRGIYNYYVEKELWHKEIHCDVRGFDTSLLKINDNTKIEGYFQSEEIISKFRSSIREWLTVSDEFDCYDFSDENVCVLNIRGGEYRGNYELILEKKYWLDSMNNMLKINPKMEFVIITDDVKYSNKLLPDIPSFHFSIGKDYSCIKNAHHIVVANSSFSFFPVWTSTTVKNVIAPKYWARHNISNGFWACEFNLYRDWLWQDRSGKLFSYEECKNELEEYKIKNYVLFSNERPNKKDENLFNRAVAKYKRALLKFHRLISGKNI